MQVFVCSHGAELAPGAPGTISLTTPGLHLSKSNYLIMLCIHLLAVCSYPNVPTCAQIYYTIYSKELEKAFINVLEQKDQPEVTGIEAEVIIKGTEKRPGTNLNGDFVLSNVKLSAIDEIVRIVYGPTTKRASNGNIGTIKTNEIEKQPGKNPYSFYISKFKLPTIS